MPKVRDLLEKSKPSTVILHVGTNNTKDDPDTVVNKLVYAAETVTEKSSASVTLSSIIHRRSETIAQKNRVQVVNRKLQDISSLRGWGFISNSNINDVHLANDGVHLNSRGTATFASNLIKHLKTLPNYPVSGSDQRPSSTPHRSYVDVLKSPPSRDRPQRPMGFRRGHQPPARRKPFHRQERNVKYRHRDQDWMHYLNFVSQVMNPM